MRVLIIEDDSSMLNSIIKSMKESQFIIDYANLGEHGLEIAKLYEYDVITLDLTLPDISGIEVLKRLRSSKIQTPVLVLSGTFDTQTKLTLFQYGADDYVIKPCSIEELKARILALIRRYNGHSSSVIEVGDIKIHTTAKEVYVCDKFVKLTSKEYAVLELLCLRKNITLTKETFLNHLYGGIDEPELKIIDVFVCKVRSKLANVAGNRHNYISTVWGQGYVLRDQTAQDYMAQMGERAKDILAQQTTQNHNAILRH